MLWINAESAQGESKINDYVSMKGLSLSVSLDMTSHKVLAATIDCEQVAVSLGFGDSTTGAMVIKLEDNTLALEASLVIKKPVRCGDAFTLAGGSFQLSLISDSDKKVEMSLAIAATGRIDYSAGSDPLTLAIKGTYSSVSGEISLVGSAVPMIPNVFGLDVLSVGKLGIAHSLIQQLSCCWCAGFSTTIVGGKVETVTLDGTLCLGAEENCEDGMANDLNLVAGVTMAYGTPAAGGSKQTLIQAANGASTTTEPRAKETSLEETSVRRSFGARRLLWQRRRRSAPTKSRTKSPISARRRRIFSFGRRRRAPTKSLTAAKKKRAAAAAKKKSAAAAAKKKRAAAAAKKKRAAAAKKKRAAASTKALTKAPTKAGQKKSWVLTAKVSNLNIRKAVSIIAGDTAIAKKIPDIIANIGLSAIQDDCKADSPIDGCYFLIAVTTHSQQPDGIPVVLQPGLTITAKLTMPPSNSPSLVSFTVPLKSSSSSPLYAPGESARILLQLSVSCC